MREIRLILILLVGSLLTNFTYQTKYHTFFFDELIGGGLMLTGLLIFVWTIIQDIALFKTEKRFQNFILTLLSIIFMAVVLTLEVKINHDLNKPTLLKVFYDGDYNGTAIDFKNDGTYIFDNSAIGTSNYLYGIYKIKGNKITMDKDQIDNLTNLKYLEITEKQLKGGETGFYLYQVDSLGNFIERSDAYRVTTDNREK